MPHDLTSTPVKGAQKKSAPESPTSTKKQKPKPATTMSTTAEKAPTGLLERIPSPEPNNDVSEDLRARMFSKFSPMPPVKESPGLTTDKTTDKPTEKEQSIISHTIAVVLPKDIRTGSTGDCAVKPSMLTPADTEPAKVTSPAKDTVKKTPQLPSTPAKKQKIEPTPITIHAFIAQKQTTTPTTPVTLTKRPAAFGNGTEPERKRMNALSAPMPPSTPLSTVSRVPLGSPSPKPMSVEGQLAEQRKKLEVMRKKRLEIAKKQTAVDKELEPHQEHMKKELERLRQEMMEE